MLPPCFVSPLAFASSASINAMAQIETPVPLSMSGTSIPSSLAETSVEKASDDTALAASITRPDNSVQSMSTASIAILRASLQDPTTAISAPPEADDEVQFIFSAPCRKKRRRRR